jgi:SnoaL-like protein
MTESVPRGVVEAADIVAVSQLLLRERFGRDLGLWEQMRDCYHDDSIVRISWMKGSGPEFVRHSKQMVERGVQANHHLGPILVTLAGDRAIGQFTGTIDIPSALKGIDVIMSSGARFLVRAERRAGPWRISGFDIVYLRDKVTPVIPGQVLAIDPEAVKAFRPSYRFMSYSLTLSGFPVPNDLPGIDRPDLVDLLVREVYEWASLAVAC